MPEAAIGKPKARDLCAFFVDAVAPSRILPFWRYENQAFGLLAVQTPIFQSIVALDRAAWKGFGTSAVMGDG